jgi:hypothetical protein
MTARGSVEDVVNVILVVAFKNRIVEPNVEAGFERFTSLTNGAITETEFHAAVANCLARHLIREPIRLPEGALQCHWHFELTPAGIDAARQIIDRDRS